MFSRPGRELLPCLENLTSPQYLSEHNDGKVRHLTEELQWLLDHKREFPDDPHDPSPLELFCEQNPDEPECLVYDD